MRRRERVCSPTGLVIEQVHEKQTYSVQESLNHSGFGLYQKGLVFISCLGAASLGARLSIIARLAAFVHTTAQIHLYASVVGITIGTFLWKYFGGKMGRKGYLILSLLLAMLSSLHATTFTTSIPSILASASIFVGLVGSVCTPSSITIELSSTTKHKLCYLYVTTAVAIGFALHSLFSWIYFGKESITISLLVTRFTLNGTNLVSMASTLPLLCILFVMPVLPESITFLLEQKRFEELETLLKDIVIMNDRPLMHGHLIELLEERMVGVEMPSISVTPADDLKSQIVQTSGVVGPSQPVSRKPKLGSQTVRSVLLGLLESCLFYGTLMISFLFTFREKMNILSLVFVCIVDIPALIVLKRFRVSIPVLVTSCFSSFGFIGLAFANEYMFTPLLLFVRLLSCVSRKEAKSCDDVFVSMIGLITTVVLSGMLVASPFTLVMIYASICTATLLVRMVPEKEFVQPEQVLAYKRRSSIDTSIFRKRDAAMDMIAPTYQPVSNEQYLTVPT